MQNPYGYIYKITNSITGETYIGQRKLKLDKSWRQYMGSGKLIKNAINIYGKENFIKSIIVYCESEAELSQKEEFFINEEKKKGLSNYNIAVSVNNPNIASLIGAKNAAIKSRLNLELRYQEFCTRHSDTELKDLVDSYKSAAKIADLINEPVNLVKIWFDRNNIVSKRYTKNLEVEQANKNSNRSKAAKNAWADKTKRANIIKGQTGRIITQEQKDNMSKSHKYNSDSISSFKNCLWCNKEFIPTRVGRQFCSISCAAYARHNGLPSKA